MMLRSVGLKKKTTVTSASWCNPLLVPFRNAHRTTTYDWREWTSKNVVQLVYYCVVLAGCYRVMDVFKNVSQYIKNAL